MFSLSHSIKCHSLEEVAMWAELGFTQNIYDHLPITANEAGERLLVGRENELAKLMARIRGRNAIPTLEGEIGVGKTSIISVSSFRLEQRFFTSGGDCYLALDRPFQLDGEETADSFSQKVYQQVLIKIHSIRKDLIAKGINVGETSKLFDWISSEQYNAIGGTIASIGGSISPSPNTSDGFSTLGFQNRVNLLLKGMYPSAKKGGVICVIDNLELLEKSTRAKALLEAMRDKVLTAHGLIWVICGARGIVRGVASSQRLQGYLSKPIDIAPLSIDQLDDLIERRISEYSITGARGDAPVEQEGFVHIFRICKENLRTAFKFCSDYSEWYAEGGHKGSPSSDKFGLLEAWLASESDEILSSIRLSPKPWEIFERIIDRGGSIAPSDHLSFGYETPMAMRPQIKSLEDYELVDSTIDDTDQRRRTISVTPKGWLVNYARRGYPQPAA